MCIKCFVANQCLAFFGTDTFYYVVDFFCFVSWFSYFFHLHVSGIGS